MNSVIDGIVITTHSIIRYAQRVEGVLDDKEAENLIDMCKKGIYEKTIKKKLSKLNVNYDSIAKTIANEIKNSRLNNFITRYDGNQEVRKYRGKVFICDYIESTGLIKVITVFDQRRFY